MGCVAPSDRQVMNVGKWKSRWACGWNMKNISTLMKGVKNSEGERVRSGIQMAKKLWSRHPLRPVCPDNVRAGSVVSHFKKAEGSRNRRFLRIGSLRGGRG